MIDVLKLPDELSIDRKIEDKISEVYGTCPYCGNCEPYDKKYDRAKHSFVGVGVFKETVHTTYMNGPKKISGSGLFKKKYEWYRAKFECRQCGMEWQSPEYPKVGDDTEANNAIFRAWQNGKNMEINTLLLECFKE